MSNSFDLSNVTVCPFCQGKARSVTEVTGVGIGPQPGDYCFCDKCRKMAVFTEDLQLRKPTNEELFLAALEASDRELDLPK